MIDIVSQTGALSGVTAHDMASIYFSLAEIDLLWLKIYLAVIFICAASIFCMALMSKYK